MSLKTFFAIAAGALSIAAAGAANAASIVGLYNTGVDNNKVSVTTNGADLHWSLTDGVAYVGGQNGVFPLNGPWLPENTTSRWIGPTPLAGTSVDPRNNGYYEYNLAFNLTAVEASAASFSARFAADNAVSWIKLNNTQLVATQSGGFSSWTNFSASQPAFQVGQNNLTVRVVNFGQATGNPSGLRVEFLNSTAGAVPEPGAWALMIVGFGAAGTLLRRQKRLAAA